MAKLTILKPRLGSNAAGRLSITDEGEAGRVARRGTAAERGYDGAWSKASIAFRAAHPFCMYCALDGVAALTALTDHLYPHGRRRGFDSEAQRILFWRRDLWVASCQDCHKGMKARVEAEGVEAIDVLAMRLGVTPLLEPDLRRVCEAALLR